MRNKEIVDTEKGCFENYPFSTVFISNLVSLATYASGTYIIFQAGLVCGIFYFAYILYMEILLLRKSCRDCYYYGKVCAFGKGKLACLVVKKGNTNNFSKKPMTWKSMIPDIIVTAIPVITSIVLMIINFNWVLLALVIVMFGLGTAGNGYVRGTLACKYCKQRKPGCSAEKLFNRTKTGQ
jgi:hypothetical protein